MRYRLAQALHSIAEWLESDAPHRVWWRIVDHRFGNGYNTSFRCFTWHRMRGWWYLPIHHENGVETRACRCGGFWRVNRVEDKP